MAKADKQVIIDAIIKEIEKGEGRGKVLGKIGKKWEISRTTFDRIWKTANEQQKERQRKAKDAADEAYIQASADAAKVVVMSSQERKEMLSKIARGELTLLVSDPKEPAKLIEVPAMVENLERIKAISELNKMEGDYAPTKVAQTNKDGEDVNYEITLKL